MRTVSDFILDDTVDEGYIAAVEDLHGELSFEYRPLRVMEIAKITALASNRSIAIGEVHREMQKLAAESIKSWSLRQRDGGVLPITAENVGRIKPAIYDKLWLILVSERASDMRPDDAAAV